MLFWNAAVLWQFLFDVITGGKNVFLFVEYSRYTKCVYIFRAEPIVEFQAKKQVDNYEVGDH